MKISFDLNNQKFAPHNCFDMPKDGISRRKENGSGELLLNDALALAFISRRLSEMIRKCFELWT